MRHLRHVFDGVGGQLMQIKRLVISSRRFRIDARQNQQLFDQPGRSIYPTQYIV